MSSAAVCFVLLLGIGIQICAAFYPCQSGFVSNNRSCYYFAQDFLSWHDAREECLSRNSSLLEITSQDESDFITTRLQSVVVQRIWIGATDLLNEGTWIWNNSGSDLSAFTNWANNQPDNRFSIEHCLVIKTSLDWADLRCQRKLKYICEYPWPNVTSVLSSEQSSDSTQITLSLHAECYLNSTIVVDNIDVDRFRTSFANGTSTTCTTTYNDDFSRLTIEGCALVEDILLVFTNRSEDEDPIIGGVNMEAYIIRCNDINSTGLTRQVALYFTPVAAVERLSSITPTMELIYAVRDDWVFGSSQVHTAQLSDLLYWTIDIPVQYHGRPVTCSVFSGTSIVGSSHQTTLITDGCSLDASLVSNFVNTVTYGDQRRIWASFHVFKYYDSDYITIQCTIAFCWNEADCAVTCPSRRRRDAHTDPTEFRLATTMLRIVENMGELSGARTISASLLILVLLIPV